MITIDEIQKDHARKIAILVLHEIQKAQKETWLEAAEMCMEKAIEYESESSDPWSESQLMAESLKIMHREFKKKAEEIK